MPFVQTLRCSCEKVKGQVEKWHLAWDRCRGQHKKTQRDKGRESEATAALELLVHSAHTKSISVLR